VGNPAMPAFNKPENIAFASQNASNFTGTIDKPLFENVFGEGYTDNHFWVYAPPGVYQITFNTMASIAPGNTVYTFAGQGSTLVSDVDLTVPNGQWGPFTYQTNLTVGANELLQFSEFAPNAPLVNCATTTPCPPGTVAIFASVGVAPIGTVVSVSDVLPEGHEVAP
jgi:hypothetical protein